MNLTEYFLSFTLLGAGWVLWLLVILSVLSVSVMIERAVFFRRNVARIETVLPAFLKNLGAGDWSAVRKILEAGRGLDTQAVTRGLDAAPHGEKAIETAIDEGVALMRPQLERKLAFLGTVGNNAPFVGLFGTVIGIIQAFHDLSLNTKGGASAVMSGISEALVATAIGLLVAIPAVAAYNYFQRRVKTALGNVEVLRHALLSSVRSGTGPAEGKG